MTKDVLVLKIEVTKDALVLKIEVTKDALALKIEETKDALLWNSCDKRGTCLEHGVVARVEAIHAGETLAGGTTAQQFHVSLQRQPLTQVVCCLPLQYTTQKPFYFHFETT